MSYNYDSLFGMIFWAGLILLAILLMAVFKMFPRAEKRLRKIILIIYLATILLGIIITAIIVASCDCDPHMICLCPTFTEGEIFYGIKFCGLILALLAAPILIIESVIFLLILIINSRKLKNRVDNKVNKFKAK